MSRLVKSWKAELLLPLEMFFHDSSLILLSAVSCSLDGHPMLTDISCHIPVLCLHESPPLQLIKASLSQLQLVNAQVSPSDPRTAHLARHNALLTPGRDGVCVRQVVRTCSASSVWTGGSSVQTLGHNVVVKIG